MRWGEARLRRRGEERAEENTRRGSQTVTKWGKGRRVERVLRCAMRWSEVRRGRTRCGEVRGGRGKTSRDEARQKDKTGEYTAGSSRALGTHTGSLSWQRCALFSVSLSFFFPFSFRYGTAAGRARAKIREREGTRERRLACAAERERAREKESRRLNLA